MRVLKSLMFIVIVCSFDHAFLYNRGKQLHVQLILSIKVKCSHYRPGCGPEGG